MDGLERRLIELNDALLKLTVGQLPTEETLQNARQVLSGSKMQIDTGLGNDTVIINNQGNQNDCECPPGPQGPVGETGPQGEEGPRGPKGESGEAGSIGPTGPEGPQGKEGPRGPKGEQGEIGPIGKTGEQGPQGEEGPSGIDGESGLPGEKGDRGESGPTGPPGPAGECTIKCSAILVSKDYIATMDDYYIGVNSTRSVAITLPTDCSDCHEIIVKAEMKSPLGNRKVIIKTIDGATINDDDDYVIEVAHQSVHLTCRGGDWWTI